MRVCSALVPLFLIALLQIGCDESSSIGDTDPSSYDEDPVAVTDCESAAHSLRNAGNHVRNVAGNVEHRCVNTSRGFNSTKCMIRLDEAAEALKRVDDAESDVRSKCATL